MNKYVNTIKEYGIEYDIQDARVPQASADDSGKALVVDSEGALEFGEVSGGNDRTPIATFDGVNYYHKIETKDLDRTNTYNLINGEIMSPGLYMSPFLHYVVSRPNPGWDCCYGILETPPFGTYTFTLEEEEGAVTLVDKSHFTENRVKEFIVNAYVVHEDDNIILYYTFESDFVSEKVTDYVEHNLIFKQDSLIAGYGIRIDNNVINVTTGGPTLVDTKSITVPAGTTKGTFLSFSGGGATVGNNSKPYICKLSEGIGFFNQPEGSGAIYYGVIVANDYQDEATITMEVYQY